MLKAIHDLKLWQANYREGDVGAVMTSIATFGYNRSISVWLDDIVIAGNHVLKALIELEKMKVDAPKNVHVIDGNWHIDVSDVSHLNDMQAQAYAIADNRTNALATNDDEQLVNLLSQLANYDKELMEATGYDGSDLDAMLYQLTRLGDMGSMYLSGADQKLDATPKEALEIFKNASIKQIVLYFNLSEYDDFLNRLRVIMDAEGIEDNTSAILWILEEYENHTSESP